MIIIKHTKSICPDCYQILDAEVFEMDGHIFMRKTALSTASLKMSTDLMQNSTIEWSPTKRSDLVLRIREQRQRRGVHSTVE